MFSAVNNKLPETNPPPSEPVTSWYVTSAPTKPWKPITGNKFVLIFIISSDYKIYCLNSH